MDHFYPVTTSIKSLKPKAVSPRRKYRPSALITTFVPTLQRRRHDLQAVVFRMNDRMLAYHEQCYLSDVTDESFFDILNLNQSSAELIEQSKAAVLAIVREIAPYLSYYTDDAMFNTPIRVVFNTPKRRIKPKPTNYDTDPESESEYEDLNYDPFDDYTYKQNDTVEPEQDEAEPTWGDVKSAKITDFFIHT